MAHWWEIVATVATAVGSIATAVTVGFIAYQTRQTNATLRQSQRALSIAQRQQIDGDMPKLSTEGEWPYGLYRYFPPNVYDAITSPTDEVFDEAKAEEHCLTAEFCVLVTNDGPRTAQLTVDRFQPRLERSTITLKPHEHGRLYTRVTLSVAEWIRQALETDRAWDSHRNPTPYIYQALNYSHPGDFGANEVHLNAYIGSIVERDPNSYSRWRVARGDDAASGPLRLVDPPFSREYFSSRSRDERLI